MRVCNRNDSFRCSRLPHARRRWRSSSWSGLSRGTSSPTRPGRRRRPALPRGKRRLAPWVDTPAAKRPKAAPSAAQRRQAEALEDLREAELKIDGLAAKSAQQERLIAHLERFNAHVLEENEELRRLLLAKEG